MFACNNKKNSIDSLFSQIQEYERSTDSFNDLANGKHPETIAPYHWEAMQDSKVQYEEFLNRLNGFADASLTRQEQISKATMKLKLENLVSGTKYKVDLIPFNAEGGFYNNLNYYLSSLPFDSKADYEAYINWLPLYANYLKEGQALMAQGIKEKIVAPKVVVNNNIGMLKIICDSMIEDSQYFAPFKNMPESFSETDIASLTQQGREVLSETVKPAFDSLLAFFENQYLPVANDKVGISNVPGGKEYYEDRVRYYTTLDLSPDSIFNLGHSEVSRIKASMQKIIDELEFEGSFSEFLYFLRTDPQFFAKTGDELLHYAAWLSKKAEGQLPKLFSELYELPFTVEPVPDAIAPNYTGGRYVHGSFDLEQAGIYWVNTYNLPARTLYTIPALSLHEAVPGHHLQTTIAAELEDIPEFRKQYYISAYGEGWGLYSEYLGEEMGMYEDPYDLFGRYTYEMWRACRLVVDVGMHYKGWTRQQALDFLSENTALSNHEIGTEIDRYIGWPGQALSYKVGEITIKNLREKAEKEMGEKFDIKEFHKTVLKNGSIPLSILSEEVETLIQNSTS
jgi:uncharacterized protein (DUF885 family)